MQGLTQDSGSFNPAGNAFSIVVNDWGFRQDDLGKRVVRRYIPR